MYSGMIDNVRMSLKLKQRHVTDVNILPNWYYSLNCDKYLNEYNSNNVTIEMTDWYKRQRVKCSMQYLQHEIFPYIAMEKKSYLKSNSDMFVENFNCGYSTLVSHQCPIIKSIYLCPGLNDRLFENYTIALSKHANVNHTNFTNTFFEKYFSNNIEKKFLKRLFENGTFFNDYNGKKKTILIIGTSHLRQIYESILCILIQFNFTNIKLWKNLNDDQLINYYNNLNYNNSNNEKKWKVDIQSSNTKN